MVEEVFGGGGSGGGDFNGGTVGSDGKDRGRRCGNIVDGTAVYGIGVNGTAVDGTVANGTILNVLAVQTRKRAPPPSPLSTPALLPPPSAPLFLTPSRTS